MATGKQRDPKEGDMIEFFRGNYQHWAVYVGNGEVVHLANPPDAGPVCGNLISCVTNKAVVLKETLEEVATSVPGKKKSNWRVNNYLDNTTDTRPADEIVKDALSRVNMLVDYSIANYNCEHFATELRYGKEKKNCGQVEEVKEKATIGGYVLAALSGVVSSAAGIAAIAKQ